MKKKALLVVAFAVVVLCQACGSSQKACGAYAKKNASESTQREVRC